MDQNMSTFLTDRCYVWASMIHFLLLFEMISNENPNIFIHYFT